MALGVEGIMTAITIFANSYTSRKMYKYLQKQEEAQVRASMVQAKRAQLKGDILLSNIVANHTIAQGRNELAIAAQGQNMARAVSGSSLDVLVQNRRYQIRDERTTALNTIYEVENIKRNGYIDAISTAGKAMGLAYSNMTSAIASGTAELARMYSQQVNNNIGNNQQASLNKVQANDYNAVVATSSGRGVGTQTAQQVAPAAIQTPIGKAIGQATAQDFSQLHIGYQ